MTLPAPLDQVAAHVDPTRVEHSAIDGETLIVRYVLELPDGQVRRFHLRIDADRGGVAVREEAYLRALPAACPERHINGDGTFCLGLRGADEPDLSTQVGVETWWARLAGFLTLQLYAEVHRHWPEEYAWRHGAAAVEQRALERTLAAHPWLAGKVAAGPIVVTERGRLANRRAPCPCGSGEQTRRCHEAGLVMVADAPRKIAELETDYYRHWSTPCCATMATCGVSARCEGGE